MPHAARTEEWASPGWSPQAAAELEEAATIAKRHLDRLWHAADRDWEAIELAIDDLSAIVGLLQLERERRTAS